MTPYYDDGQCVIYHGDCREVLAVLPVVDVVMGDPPYDTETHAGARSLGLESRARASSGRREIASVGVIDIHFDPADVAYTSQLTRWALRWCILFCSLEMLGAYREHSGDCWVRGGFWRRPDGAPQITGDRPGQPGEGIAIMHRPGKKRWNGGGHHAYYSHCVVKHGRVHPTQKPESLMAELVALYSEPGETILDPFMGSGTTLVAAKRAGRKAIGIELEEKYCAAAAERLAQGALDLFGEASA